MINISITSVNAIWIFLWKVLHNSADFVIEFGENCIAVVINAPQVTEGLIVFGPFP